MADKFVTRLIVGVAILILALAALATYRAAHAQGGGYYIAADPPPDAQPWKKNRFYMTVNNAGVNEQWVSNVAGYVVYDDGRPTDYLILRMDNLQNIADMNDPICPTFAVGWHPFLTVPPPTYLIWSEDTLRPYIHAPC